MTTAGLEPATFWCQSTQAIEAKRATIAPGSHKHRLDIANCQRLLFFSGWFWVSDDMLCTIAMI